MILSEKHKVICYGEALWDVYPDSTIPGGAPMNVAIHLKNLGIDVEVISKIGDDKLGNDLLSFISQNGLSTDHITKDSNHPTGKVNVDINELGNASYEICNPSAWDYIELNHKIKNLLLKTDIIVYGTLSSRNPISRETLDYLLNTDAIKIIDVNLRPTYNDRKIIEPLLYKADIIKLNDDEMYEIVSWSGKKLTENKAIEWFCSTYGCSTLLLTLGEKGAKAYSDGHSYKHEGFKIKAIDTVGSGDSFLAAFIASIVEKKPIETALDFACATGSYVATKNGATPKISREEIQRFKSSLV